MVKSIVFRLIVYSDILYRHVRKIFIDLYNGDNIYTKGIFFASYYSFVMKVLIFRYISYYKLTKYI